METEISIFLLHRVALTADGHSVSAREAEVGGMPEMGLLVS